MTIEKLKADKHRRRWKIDQLPEPYRTAAMQKRHELLIRWQQQKRPILQNWRQCYGLATAIAIECAVHPKGSDWGVSMIQRHRGLVRFRQSTSDEWRVMSRNGGLCARTTRRTRRRREQLESERKALVASDGVIPNAWTEKKGFL